MTIMQRLRVGFQLALMSATALAACSHQSLSGVGPAYTLPSVVQPGSPQPNWVIFSPVGTAGVGQIASGFSTHMWMSQAGGASGDNTIIRMAFDGSTLPINTPTRNTSPAGLTEGPNGNMWFAESNAGQLGEIAMPAGPITEFPLTSSSEQPIGVATGADGNVWFIDANVGIVGKMSVTGAVKEYRLQHITFGRAITAGPDGNVWFVGFRDVNQQFTGFVGKVTPSGSITEYQIPGLFAAPTDIISGPDGYLWVAAPVPTNYSGNIIRVSLDGSMLEHGSVGQPQSIARDGPYGFVFTVQNQNLFGTIDLDGLVIAHALPGGKDARAFWVAHGPDGNDWFTGSIGASSAVFVRVHDLMTVSPSSLTFSAPGQSQTITVTERAYHHAWTAQSSNKGVATVIPGNAANTFIVTAVGSGNCTVTVNDTIGNSYPISVVVQ